MMCVLPLVNKDYAMILGDECKKNVAATTGVLGPSPGHANFEVAMHTRNFNLEEVMPIISMV